MSDVEKMARLRQVRSAVLVALVLPAVLVVAGCNNPPPPAPTTVATQPPPPPPPPVPVVRG